MQKKPKKWLWAILIVLWLGCVAALLLYALTPKITPLAEEQCFELDQKVSVKALFDEKTQTDRIENAEDYLDTAALGLHSVSYRYSGLFGNPKEGSLTYRVVDKTAPVIHVLAARVLLNHDINLSDYVTITDNSKEIIAPVFNGTVDTLSAGLYPITVTATDSSGNSSEAELNVEVYDTEVVDGKIRKYFLTAKGFLGYTEEGFTYIDDILIVNKTYGVPYGFNAHITAGQAELAGLQSDVQAAFAAMQAAAKLQGLNLTMSSGYRSYKYQENLYKSRLNAYGLTGADLSTARPGFSEHQTGLCFDLNSCDESFTATKEFEWVNANAWRYGFILRYPDGKTEYTGYKFESWHYRYVGAILASELYNNGNGWISLEEYFGISSRYAD